MSIETIDLLQSPWRVQLHIEIVLKLSNCTVKRHDFNGIQLLFPASAAPGTLVEYRSGDPTAACIPGTLTYEIWRCRRFVVAVPKGRLENEEQSLTRELKWKLLA